MVEKHGWWGSFECEVYFLLVAIGGNFVLLTMFLAILLSNISVDDGHPESTHSMAHTVGSLKSKSEDALNRLSGRSPKPKHSHDSEVGVSRQAMQMANYASSMMATPLPEHRALHLAKAIDSLETLNLNEWEIGGCCGVDLRLRDAHVHRNNPFRVPQI